MSRISIRGLLLAAIFAVIPVCTHGQVRGPREVRGTRLTISAPVTERSTPSTLTLPITVNDLTGQGVIAFQFVMSYDANVIDPFGPDFGCSTSGTISGAAGQAATCNVQPDGTLKVSVSGANPMTGSGTVLDLTFGTDVAAVAGNVSQLDFSAVHFYNTAGEIASGSSNGSVTLTAALASVSGRLVTLDGRAIRAGELMLADNAGGEWRGSVATRGEFRLVDIPAGKTYVLSATSHRFKFQPVVLNLTDDVVGLDLVGRISP